MHFRIVATHCIVSTIVATLAARNEASTRLQAETSDSRFSDEFQQGRLNLDVMFTTDVDVDDVHDDQVQSAWNRKKWCSLSRDDKESISDIDCDADYKLRNNVSVNVANKLKQNELYKWFTHKVLLLFLS